MTGTLIVALDLDTRAEAEMLIERLGDKVDFYKIGYQLAYGGDGLDLGKALLQAGKKVFFDLKLLDIDNTVEKARRRHRRHRRHDAHRARLSQDHARRGEGGAGHRVSPYSASPC